MTVSPAKSALRKNIEGYIGSLGKRDLAELEQYRKTAETLAKQASQALGYYQAQIRSEVIADDPPLLQIYVQRGEPVRLRSVDIRVLGAAASQASFRVPSHEDLQPGKALNHGTYEQAKSAIHSQASRYGYFDGRFLAQRLLIDPNEGVADIELVYESGRRYRLGEVSFNSDAPLDPDLLQRMLPFKGESDYDSELIAELYSALQSSGYFGGVRIDSEPATAVDGVIPLHVQLQMREPRSLGLGLGFSTDVGPRARVNWTKHWANRWGHSYGYEAELSAPRQNVGLFYDVPGKKPQTDKLRYSGGYQYEEIADTDSVSRLIRLGPEWHSLRPNGWQRVLSLKWQHEDYRLGDDSGLSTLLMPGVSYSRLKSDNSIDPSQGYRVQLEISAAKEGLISDADIVRTTASLKGLTTLWDKHRFLGRVQAGGTFSSGYSKVPPSLRYFAGGDQSVRGYDYQSLSPRNNLNDRIGGRYLLAGSLEYQYEFIENWRLAAFVDKGGAFNDWGLSPLKTGVGMGIRWVSPVGPLRLDLANGLDEDGGFRIHFSMGPEL